jgi:hypothetical protein
MLLREIIGVYSEKHRMRINKLCGKNWKYFNIKVGGTCSYCLPLGATAQGELWSPVQSASIPRLTVWFLNNLVFMV